MAANDSYKVETKIVRVPTARRHVIKINDLIAKSDKYVKKSIMISKELISTKTKVLAFFCNEYIPDYMDQESIKYYMTVNGKDYEIVPVNSNRNGKKIIRFAENSQSADYSIYLDEEIKSAKLTIIIEATEDSTPYVSNIKILVGGNNNV